MVQRVHHPALVNLKLLEVFVCHVTRGNIHPLAMNCREWVRDDRNGTLPQHRLARAMSAEPEGDAAVSAEGHGCVRM